MTDITIILFCIFALLCYIKIKITENKQIKSSKKGQQEFYPFCNVAYKTENAIGWNLALISGDKDSVTEKCKKYNWFDYIVFNGGKCHNTFEDVLNYSPSPDDVHMCSYWIYWKDLNKWFVKDDEIIPYPTNDCEETNNIQFTYDFGYDDNIWNDFDDFDGSEEFFVSTKIDFTTDKQHTDAMVEISAMYNNFEKFIKNLKTQKFGVCHVEEFTNYKLIAWEKDEKIRFMIQHYTYESQKKDLYKNTPLVNEYVPVVFDVLVDKAVFFDYFEQFYNSLKTDSQKLLQDMMDYSYKKLGNYRCVNEDDYELNCYEFKKKKELRLYLISIKPMLVGKTIDNIFISPEFYDVTGEDKTYIDGYNLKTINEGAHLSTYLPVILEINNHKFICYMYSGSKIHIALDKEITIKDKNIPEYCNVSTLFSKNIIGQKIKRINIDPISIEEAQASFNFYYKDVLSDDMFYGINFELENGFYFNIYTDLEDTEISESKGI